VSEVVQQGWRFRDKVLRFARVVVAKNGEPDQAE
jgi:molecular chaperone GrpE (heat shock protein)